MTTFLPHGRREAMFRVAAKQGDVLAAAQLYELGLTPEQVKTLLRHGVLHRVHHGVYSVSTPKPEPYGRLHAALLAGGPKSFLSHRSAPPEHKLWKRYAREIHVTVPGTYTPKNRDGIIFHRTTDLNGVVSPMGLRVSNIERMLIELSPMESVGTLLRLIEKAINRGRFDPLQLEAAFERNHRRAGLANIKQAAARYRPHPDLTSELEESFRTYQESDPRLPVPVYGYRERPWEIDVAWPELKVCLELDGRPYHEVRKTMDKDHRKMRRLQIQGWLPIRVTDFEWDHNRESLIEDVLETLALARGDVGGSAPWTPQS